jgi:hypothetical protein
LHFGQFARVAGTSLVLLVARSGNRLLGHIEMIGVEVLESGEHLRVEGVGVDAGSAAPVDTVAVASEAGVVAVATRGRSAP